MNPVINLGRTPTEFALVEKNGTHYYFDLFDFMRRFELGTLIANPSQGLFREWNDELRLQTARSYVRDVRPDAATKWIMENSRE